MRHDASFTYEVEGVHCSTASGLSPGPVFLNYCFPFELPVPLGRASPGRSSVSSPLLSPPVPLCGVSSHQRFFPPSASEGARARWLFRAFTIPGLYSVGYFGRGGQRERSRSAGAAGPRGEEAPRCVSMFTRRNKRRRRRRGRCHRRAVISYYFGPLMAS